MTARYEVNPRRLTRGACPDTGRASPTVGHPPLTNTIADHSAELAIAAPGFCLQFGDPLTAQHRFAAGRLQYQTAANLDRSGGDLPVEAVRRVSNTSYFEDNYGKAREVHFEPAAEAGEFGDCESQLWALADAAWLADLAGDDASFKLSLGDVERLLDTHDIPGARYEVRTILLKNFAAFSPHLESGDPGRHFGTTQRDPETPPVRRVPRLVSVRSPRTVTTDAEPPSSS